jgi:type I restriction enzyme, S subunit
MSKVVRLGNIVNYSSKRIKSDVVTLESFVTTDNILQNKAGITAAINLPPQGNAMPAYQTGNILVANIRPYLKKIWFADRAGGCSADVLVFDVNKGYDPKYVYYSLFRDDFFDHVMKGSKGTKMPRGDKNQILDFLIPDFDLSTQHRISAVLSSLDSKIELNKRINAELEAMAKTLYDYWFVQFDFPFDFAQGRPDPNGKPYKTSGGKMVWNEELKREIPEGWEVKSINYYAEVIDPHPSHRAPLEVLNGFPFAGIGDIDESGNIDLNKARVIDEEFVLKQERDYTINEYSIGYGRVGTVGKVVKLRKQPFRFAISPTMAIIKPKNDKLPTFVFYTVKSPIFLQWVNKYTSGSTRPAIGIQHLRTIPVIKPKAYKNNNLLDKFEELAKGSLIQSDVLNKENQQLSALRDWLLPMLMNGQVTVGETTNIEVKKVERNIYPINMQKLLRVARELHLRGYEKLRVVPSLSPSGMSWRCSFVAEPENGIVTSTWLSEYFNNEREIEYSIIELTEIFEREHMRFLESCKGKNKDYVEWYQNMLSHLEEDELPYAFAEYFSPTDYWKTTNDQKIETLPNEKNFYYGY